jgi:hypothetical protein
VPGEQIHGKKNGTLEAGGRTAPHTNEWWRRLGRPHALFLVTFFCFGRSQVGLCFSGRLFWVRRTGYCNPVCWPVVSAQCADGHGRPRVRWAASTKIG